jgi:hypothetical protein
MTTLSLTNATTWVHDTDMTSYLNQVALKTSAMELDVTTFGNTCRVKLGGLRQVELTENGFWTSIPDAAKFAALGIADRAVTVSPEGVEGKAAYIFQAGDFNYDQFGTVGSAAPVNARMETSCQVERISCVCRFGR